MLSVQTLLAVIFGGIVYMLMRRIGKPVADFLDEKRQVSWANLKRCCTHLTFLPFASILFEARAGFVHSGEGGTQEVHTECY